MRVTNIDHAFRIWCFIFIVHHQQFPTDQAPLASNSSKTGPGIGRTISGQKSGGHMIHREIHHFARTNMQCWRAMPFYLQTQMTVGSFSQHSQLSARLVRLFSVTEPDMPPFKKIQSITKETLSPAFWNFDELWTWCSWHLFGESSKICLSGTYGSNMSVARNSRLSVSVSSALKCLKISNPLRIKQDIIQKLHEITVHMNMIENDYKWSSYTYSIDTTWYYTPALIPSHLSWLLPPVFIHIPTVTRHHLLANRWDMPWHNCLDWISDGFGSMAIARSSWVGTSVSNNMFLSWLGTPNLKTGSFQV